MTTFRRIELAAILLKLALCLGAYGDDAALLSATVRIRVDRPDCQAFASGTIVDAREGQALVVTCGHVFRDTNGSVMPAVEVFTNGKPRLVAAKVLSYDLDSDIGLVGIWAAPVSVAKVAPKGTASKRGDIATSIGCSNGAEPSTIPTSITSIDRYQGPPNIEAEVAPVEGRSGGGLFNAKGELIGVCFAADYEGNEGLYASLESIHAELEEAGLSQLFSEP